MVERWEKKGHQILVLLLVHIFGSLIPNHAYLKKLIVIVAL